jgi:hypothetical protein
MCGSAGCGGGLETNEQKLSAKGACHYSIVVKAHRVTIMADIDIVAVRKQKKAEYKSKRIPSILNDESTESFISLRRHIYMSHVNKVQPIRVKMICIAAIQQRHINDSVLSSLKMEGIRSFLFRLELYLIEIKGTF